jgi:hypothetical protein
MRISPLLGCGVAAMSMLAFASPSAARYADPVPAASAKHTTASADSTSATTSTTTTTTTDTASADATTTTTKPMILGASGGWDSVNTLALKSGGPLAFHAYGQLNGSVPSGARFVNMQPNVTWRTVATASSGSSTYADIVRWADTLKARGGTILMSFSHEPEGKSSDWMGTNLDFINAFRHVEAIFDARGATNVEFVWNMTSNAFRVKPTDDRYAPKWYPGDLYVDDVAAEAYNWYDCGEGKGTWISFADRVTAPLAFAKAHLKPYVVAEWASQADSRRAQWIRDAGAFLVANKQYIRGAFYYQSPTPRAGCSWMLTSWADTTAFGTLSQDRLDFGL